MPAILSEPRFQDADVARQHLESLRWPNGPVCPHCGGTERSVLLQGKATRPGLYFCGDCRTQFTVTIGTVFERSKIALNVWLQAVHLMCASKKGISAKQIERMLGVTYKTAWFMCHRIREAMTMPGGGLLGSGGEAVEVDETYWGGKSRLGTARGGTQHKMKIVSLVERNGDKRSFQVAHVNVANVGPIMKEQISEKARLMTDELEIYTKIGREFAEHGVVNHKRKEYKRGDISTNAVESSFAILKCGLYGTFHSVSEKHLQRYADEFDFRWNNRSSQGVNDVARTDAALRGISGKRLTYRRTAGEQTA